ncbi:MAG TPA: pitrilysin family protein [Gemmatimonadaceae bacterium]|nr:pitrilysin family protein [Gemmatimonadaceae bacterium]
MTRLRSKPGFRVMLDGSCRALVAALVTMPVAAVVSTAPLRAQPAAVVAPAADDSLTTRYDVDGVRIIHRRTNNNLFVANLYLLGGVSLADDRSAGLEPMYLEVTERGTRKYPGDKLRRAMAQTGSEIGTVPHEDWTVYALRTTTDRLDSAWSIYTDRLMAPTLAAADFEFVRANRLAGVRQRGDSPDALLEYLADSVAFTGHPYALSTVGTERSLAGITLEDIKDFQRERMVKSRMLLVIVGNLPRADIERMVRTSIATMPAGDYAWTVPTAGGARPGSNVLIESRRLPTNYILGWWSGPSAGHADVPALRVASAILSGRLFNEVRSKRNLTYAVEARFRDRGLITGGLYVTTTQPDTTLKIMRNEIRNLQLFTLPTEYLAPLIQQFITEYFLDNETSGAQADFLARAELYQGDFRAGDRFVDDLRAVTGDDVRRVANDWMRNIRFAYIGNPTQVNRFLLMGF